MRKEGKAAYYGLYLRSTGLTPEQAAKLVAKRYPDSRAELKQRGLLPQVSLFDDGEPDRSDASAFEPKP